MESATFLAGQFLLAMPGIGDPRFDQAVIAICAHDAEGAMGIDIGAAFDGLTLHDMLRQVDIDPGAAPDVPVHRGGPVETRRGFVLHSRDWGGADTIDVAGRWALSATLDALRAIAEGRGPARWLVALGYAGLGPGLVQHAGGRCAAVRRGRRRTLGARLRRRGDQPAPPGRGSGDGLRRVTCSRWLSPPCAGLRAFPARG